MFSKNSILSFIEAVECQDIDSVREILKEKPEYLYEDFELNNIKESDLFFIALYNIISIIEAPLKVKKHPIGKTIEVFEREIDLAEAYKNGKYISSLSRLKGTEPANSMAKKAIDFHYDMMAREETYQKAKEKSQDNIWRSDRPKEIIYEYRLANNRYRITNIFNFNSRQWKTITKDLKDGHIAQETKSFNDFINKEAIHQARLKLNYDFGENIGAELVDIKTTLKKKDRKRGKKR